MSVSSLKGKDSDRKVRGETKREIRGVREQREEEDRRDILLTLLRLPSHRDPLTSA